MEILLNGPMLRIQWKAHVINEEGHKLTGTMTSNQKESVGIPATHYGEVF